MLFRKKQPKLCSNCTHSTILDDGLILCQKKGVRTIDEGCRKFLYDPCKRIPLKAKTPNFEKYDQEDFSL